MPKQTKRSNFTDAQKAAIYSRDPATCVYSLKSLWLLDYGACPLFQWDWVDHIKPSARLGKAEEDNGVCASYTYNQKKKANGADNFVLLDIGGKGGTPSNNFFDFYGFVPPELEKQLFRLAAIKLCDWYFNRAVSCLIFACHCVHHETNYKRTPEYYRRAAQTKLRKFLVEREKGKVANFVERGLVIYPEQEDVQLLLSLSEEHTEKHFHQCIRQLEVIYSKNAVAMEEFWEEADIVTRRRVYDRVKKDPAISPAVLSALQSHLHFQEHDPRSVG